MFAVIYRGYVKPGRELEYQSAWHVVATYFVEECGALGSCLHKAEDGLYLAYSRWPNRATRDAVWSQSEELDLDFPQEICKAIALLKDCLESHLPEIAMDVVDDLIEGPRTGLAD